MIGCTRTEMTLFSANDESAFHLDDAGLHTRGVKRTLLGDQSTAMIDLYRGLNKTAPPSDLYFLIASDYRYGAPTMKIADRRADLGKGPVYLYYFTWETPVQGGRLKSPHTAWKSPSPSRQRQNLNPPDRSAAPKRWPWPTK